MLCLPGGAVFAVVDIVQISRTAIPVSMVNFIVLQGKYQTTLIIIVTLVFTSVSINNGSKMSNRPGFEVHR